MTKIVIDESRWIKWLFGTCVGIEVGIILMDIFFNYLHGIPFAPLRRAFNITREDAIGNWFSSLQALTIAVVLFVLYLSTSPRKKGWAILSTFFGYMAFDDATRFHERVGTSFKGWVGAEHFEAFYSGYSWQLVLLPIFGLMGLYIVYFLWSELNNTQWFQMAVGALSLLGLAVFLDFLEGLDFDLWYYYSVRHFQKLIEESLEMFGLTLLLVTFFGYLIHGRKQIVIT